MNFMVLLYNENFRLVLIDFKSETDHYYIVASRLENKAEWHKEYFYSVPYYNPETLQAALDEYKSQLEQKTEE